MILIKNGRLIDPKSKRDEIVDILIEEDKIKKIKWAVRRAMSYLNDIGPKGRLFCQGTHSLPCANK